MSVLQDQESGSIEVAETARLNAQREFDRAVSGRERNRVGQFATPPALAEGMLRLARDLFPISRPVRFLDPALGLGGFFSALIRVFGRDGIASAEGFEIEPRLADTAKRLWGSFGLRVHEGDFTRANPSRSGNEKPNLIVCNPPYVRHHHLNAEDKEWLRNAASRLGFEVNGLAGLYCYFLLLCDEWLAPGGGAIWIVPSEFLDVNYGPALKRYLLRGVTTHRIHRFAPANVQFKDALVTSVILAFTKRLAEPGHQILLTGGDLDAPDFSLKIRSDELNPMEKWGRLFALRKSNPRALQCPTLGQLFSIKRGLATGANDFFVLEESQAKRLGLPKRFLRPILPSHRLIPTDVIEVEPDGFPRGLPRLVLLECSLPMAAVKRRFPALHRYLLEGERREIPRRYLASSRSPWYAQEHRPPAPIVCTYMVRKRRDGRTFRFIRNHSQATASNVYLLLYPKPQLAAAVAADASVIDSIFEHLQKVSDLELLGRVYGGGLAKLEPKELAGLEVPEKLVGRIREIFKRDEALTIWTHSDPRQLTFRL